MGLDDPGSSVPPPGAGDGPAPAPALAPAPLPGVGEPVPDFPGPDVVVGSYRPSLFWPALTLLIAAGSVVLLPYILGPLAIITGLVAFSRGERFAVPVLALAVACMLAGLLLGALVFHHHHHSLIGHIRFT